MRRDPDRVISVRLTLLAAVFCWLMIANPNPKHECNTPDWTGCLQ